MHYRHTAVLHWFHNQRLIDPEAGREVGGVRCDGYRNIIFAVFLF